jgi:hypothetical protein
MTKSVVGAGLFSLLLFAVPNKHGVPLLCAPSPELPLAPPVVEIVESEDEHDDDANDSDDEGKPAGSMDDDFPSGSDHPSDDDKDYSNDKGKSAGSMDDDFPSGSDHRDDDKDNSDDKGQSSGSMDSSYVRCHSPPWVKKSDVWMFPDRQPSSP